MTPLSNRLAAVSGDRWVDVSLPLKDLRFGVSNDTHAILSAYARAHDLEIQEVARDVIEAWATKQLHMTIVLHGELERDGILPESNGKARKT